jgi:hypothetical protein
MAFRSVEKTQHAPSMARIPKMPVHCCMGN